MSHPQPRKMERLLPDPVLASRAVAVVNRATTKPTSGDGEEEELIRPWQDILPVIVLGLFPIFHWVWWLYLPFQIHRYKKCHGHWAVTHKIVVGFYLLLVVGFFALFGYGLLYEANKNPY